MVGARWVVLSMVEKTPLLGPKLRRKHRGQSFQRLPNVLKPRVWTSEHPMYSCWFQLTTLLKSVECTNLGNVGSLGPPACCRVTCTELDSRMAFPGVTFFTSKLSFTNLSFTKVWRSWFTPFKWNMFSYNKKNKINSWHLDHKEIQATAVWNLDLSYGNTSKKNRNENSKWECSYRGYSLKYTFKRARISKHHLSIRMN